MKDKLNFNFDPNSDLLNDTEIELEIFKKLSLHVFSFLLENER